MVEDGFAHRFVTIIGHHRPGARRQSRGMVSPVKKPGSPPPSAASYVSAASTLNSLMAIPEGTARRASLAVGVKRIVYFPTVWALGYSTVPPEKMPMLLFVVSLLTILHVHTYSTPTSHAKGRSMYSPLVLASVPPVMYFDMSPPFLTTWKPVGSNFGFGHRLILCILVSLHAFEHILGDQFHGRVELTCEYCVLFVERADLRSQLVDDVVRVGWNLSQNKSPLKCETPTIRLDCRG
nr:MAG TPA: hypothetical protein [Caudoviricetes sp.]